MCLYLVERVANSQLMMGCRDRWFCSRWSCLALFELVLVILRVQRRRLHGERSLNRFVPPHHRQKFELSLIHI